MRWMRLMLVALATIVVLYSSLCWWLYVNQERMLFHPRGLARDYDYGFQAPFDEVFIPVEGATLAAVHFRVPNPRGVVLFLHGNGETLLSAEYSGLPFMNQGYDVVAVDYRGYGKSDGKIDGEAQLLDDMRAVLAFVRSRYPDEQIVLYGRSIGSGLAIKLAAESSPRLLIVEAAYFSMSDLVAQKMPAAPRFLLRYPLRSDQWIGDVRSPIVLFHGTDDELIPYDSSVRLAALIRGPHELVTVQGGRHANIPSFPIYEQTLERVLRDGVRP
jgi:alpha-beta hydrolase superfamily lysophospholipase